MSIFANDLPARPPAPPRPRPPANGSPFFRTNGSFFFSFFNKSSFLRIFFLEMGSKGGIGDLLAKCLVARPVNRDLGCVKSHEKGISRTFRFSCLITGQAVVGSFTITQFLAVTNITFVWLNLGAHFVQFTSLFFLTYHCQPDLL